MKSQKKAGVLLSYVNIALNMVVNLVLTPMLITILSDETYSIYKVIHSLSAPLVIFNLGLATVTARFVARFRAMENADKKEKENALAMTMTVAAVMAGCVLFVAFLLLQLIPYLYGNNYSPEQILLAKQLFSVFALCAAVNILADTFKGCVTGNERFAFSNGIHTLYYLIKLGMTIVFLKLGFGALGVAIVDLINSLLSLALYAGFTFFRLHERIHLHSWNRREFQTILSFSLAMLLQTIVNQVNNNVDMIILGAMVEEKQIITMYSAALSIYSIYNSLVSVLANVLFPDAVRLVARDSTGEELTDFVIVPGRIQAMISVAIIAAFTLFGKDFITLWIGPEYSNVHAVALMLLIPVTIPLVQNVCLTILDAKMKRMVRSVVLCIMALFNIVATIILVKCIGYWGAAIATALSLVLGHGLLMNTYYHRTIGLNVLRMFREIFKGTLPCGIVAALLCLPLTFIAGNSLILFLVKCLCFCCVYGLLMWCFGCNNQEKAQLRKLLRR